MTKNKSRSTIVIVDDHPIMRDGLALRISSQPEWEVCGEAATEDEGFALVQRLRPDLAIIDISLKCGNGIDLIKRISCFAPNLKILVVSGFQESLYAERALRAGALGYLNKQDSNEKLIDAVRTVMKGERYVSAELTTRLLTKALGKQRDTQDTLEQLTDRELEIFRLIGQGLTSGAIANQLLLSTHTIDTHRENLKRKLGAKSAAELSRQAIQSMLETG